MNALQSFLAADANAGSPIGSLLFLVPVGLFLFYMMSVQPKKQRQKHAELISSLQPGDAVITNGGIHGTVTHIDGDVIEVEVDTDVVLRVSKSALAGREGPAPEAAETPDSTDARSAAKKKK